MPYDEDKTKRGIMKWYNSVKTKLIGFFLLVSIVFLLSIVTAFSMMRDSVLKENASKETALMTSLILSDIRNRQTKAEEIVLSLASVSALLRQENDFNAKIIKLILGTNTKYMLNTVSGGIWLDDNLSDHRYGDSHIYFFDRDKKGTFRRVKDYAQRYNYRHLPFYRLAKKLKPKQTAWTEVYIDPVTKKRMITVIAPIFIEGRFHGVASLDLDIHTNISVMTKDNNRIYSDRDYFIMLDHLGNIITHSANVHINGSIANVNRCTDPKIKQLVSHIAPAMEHEYKGSSCYAVKRGYELHSDKGFLQEQKAGVKERICLMTNDPFLGGDSIIVIYHFPDTHWNIIIGIPKDKVLEGLDGFFFKILLITVLLTLLATVIGYFVLHRVFVRPIESINRQLTAAISENTLLACEDHGEIGMLVENLNTRTRNLEQAKARENREHELRLEQQEMLMQQSKMAMVGEMMDSVAHQWKQPLNALMLYSEMIRNDFEEGIVDKAYVEEYRRNLQVQIDHMVNTLDEFRSFFRPNKERESFKLIEVVNSALFLAKDDILKNRILVKVERKDDIEIYGYPNEFKHLILNIINNAKDAFVENEVKQRLITINLVASELGDRLEICDNAGGIPESVIDTIFEANVTTKEDGKGTGIGLYMSQQIAQKHQAKITVENRNGGACFIVTFNYDLKKRPLSRKDIR